MKKITKRIITVSLAAFMGISAMGLTGCSNTEVLDLENPVVNVMLPAFSTVSADPDGPIVEELERYIAEQMGIDNIELNLKFAASGSYMEKVTAAMGSNNWPHIMAITDRTSTAIQNARYGSFWDLTDELKATTTDENGETVYKYPNLAKTKDIVNHNISIDGRVYGVYRARDIGRAGITIRQDWADNLYAKGALSFDGSHLDNMTMAEFEELLYAFKNNDPDGNGQNDTYGMVIAGADYLVGPLNNLAVWNGAPNEWGYNEETQQIEPSYMFKEYEDTITLMRKWVSDGVINKDIATFQSGSWNNPFLQGQTGVIIDIASRARLISQSMADLNPDANVGVSGFVVKDANSEPRTYPTTGYSGYFAIPTKAVTTEEQRDFILEVLDILNDQYASNILNYGLPGESYKEYKDGEKKVVEVQPEGATYAVVINADGSKSAKKATDAKLVSSYADLNQLGMGIVKSEIGTYYTAPIAEEVNEIMDINEGFKIPNVAESYVSETYARHSTQLDAIMDAATMKYIVSEISLEEWKAERDRWLEYGGDKVIAEMNESYQMDEARLSDDVIRNDNHKIQYQFGITQWLTEEEMAAFATEAADKPQE